MTVDMKLSSGTGVLMGEGANEGRMEEQGGAEYAQHVIYTCKKFLND